MEELKRLEKELEELEHKEFMVQMIDHWTQEDYKYDGELHEQIMKVRADIDFINKCLKGIPKKPRKFKTMIEALEKIGKVETTSPREYELKNILIQERKEQINRR